MPHNVCYVEFESNPNTKYAYLCGGLTPTVGKLVVILVGKDKDRTKLVKCVGLADRDDKATSFIFGVVQEQPQ